MTGVGPGPLIGIVEVAARAGVSPATVSRALRGIPGVSATTRNSVQEAAADLGYVASPSASALARGRTSAIGVLAPWISRWFFSAVIEGAQALVAEHGFDMLLYPVGVNAGTHTALGNIRALQKRVDGVLGLNVPPRMQPQTLSELGIPMVTVGSGVPGFVGVVVDDVEVGHLATRHLLDLGHRRIAFLGRDPDHEDGFRVAADRLRGYENALREGKVTLDPALVETTGFAIKGGEAAFDRLLASAGSDISALPSAIVTVSDEVAMGVLYAARHRGVRVPQDLSVIGVDNHDMAYLFDLTTVGQPVREQGRLAATMLLEQIRTGLPADPRVIRLEPRLVRRNTTGPPRQW